MIRIDSYGDDVLRKVREEARSALRNAAEHVLEQANQTVPLEEGDLERSGDVDVDPDGMRATVNYHSPYARKQHERLDFQHDGGRRAKWLELTVQEEGRRIIQIISSEIHL